MDWLVWLIFYKICTPVIDASYIKGKIKQFMKRSNCEKLCCVWDLSWFSIWNPFTSFPQQKVDLLKNVSLELFHFLPHKVVVHWVWVLEEGEKRDCDQIQILRGGRRKGEEEDDDKGENSPMTMDYCLYTLNKLLYLTHLSLYGCWAYESWLGWDEVAF